MRKYFFILLLCSSSMMAQNTNSDYQAFRKGVLDNYGSFRKTVLENYAKYLQGVWDEYEQFKGIKRDHEPKPSIAPKADVKPQDVTPIQSAPEVKPTVQPVPTDNPIPVKPSAPCTLPNMSFPFYGMKLSTVLCHAQTIDGIEHQAIAKAWDAYRQDRVMKDVLLSLQSLAMAYDLNDWFTFELVRTYTEALCKNHESKTVLQHFLLVNMGYDVRLASCGNQLLLLVPFSQQVYERSYLVIDGKKYYVFDDHSTSKIQNAGVYTCRLPNETDKGRNIDLTIRGGNIGIKTGVAHRFSMSDGKISLQGFVDEGTMEAIRRYPQMDIPFYAMSTIDSNFHQSLLAQVNEQIRGCSEKEAVARILHFVQYAFDYATDREQHGYEKPYFIEENFYYPKNDCEDRAILFAFLVHNLLGLDVHLVQYPGHECTAVNFSTTQMNGDGYMYKGKAFYICDPTFIGASIGQCMPGYRNVKPTVELWY